MNVRGRAGGQNRRMKSRHPHRHITLLMVIASVAASCSGGDESTGSTGPATTTPVVATTASTPSSVASTTVPEPVRTVPDPEATTVTEVLALGRPVILTHAAGEDTFPHSSMYGYLSSARMGVDIIDVDLRLSSDGVLVVQHDETTGRTADRDLVVAESTFEELHALDNSFWFTVECTCVDRPEDAYTLRGVRTGSTPAPDGFSPDDFAIPAFEEVLTTFDTYLMNIEIKGSDPDAFATADALVAMLTEYEALDRAVVTSFDDDVVAYFHSKAPTVMMTPGLDMSTQFVLGGVNPPEWAQIMQVPPVYEGIEVFTADYVSRARAAGLVTWVWPNGDGEDEAGYTALLELGADGINASNPADGVAALNTFLNKGS